MAYLETVLMRDEHIIYAARLHWITYVPAFMFTGFGWYLAHMGPANLILQYTGFTLPDPRFYVILNYIVLAVVAMGVLMLLEAYMRIKRTEMVVTNRRVLAKFGILSRDTFELFLTKVEGAQIEQGVLGRMLGYGSVHVKGTGSGMTPFDRIDSPEFFHRALMEQIRQRHVREEGNYGNNVSNND